MLIPPAVWQALLDAGIDVVPVDPRHVELGRGRRRARLVVQSPGRPLNPSDIADLGSRLPGPCLLIVPAASPAARQTAERLGWSWLLTDDRRVRGVLQISSERVDIDTGPVGKDGRRPARAGRVPWGTFTLVRLLLQRPPTTQKALAVAAAISQPRASQILAGLADSGLVRRTSSGWKAHDVDGLLRWWIDNYPGSGGITSFWYDLRPPRETVLDVVRTLKRRRSGHEPVVLVSGDVAADAVAPWRSPARGVIYAGSGMDLAARGLTPAGADEATLELTVPADLGLWTAAAAGPDEAIPLADLLQVWWDVCRSPGADRAEAANRVADLLRDPESRLSHRSTT